ncbi:MAG: L,D-transpeptidase family protein [Mogibacterium sp.]|nr:L,D-transpeptidase family protein [Mogibacterium sp.]
MRRSRILLFAMIMVLVFSACTVSAASKQKTGIVSKDGHLCYVDPKSGEMQKTAGFVTYKDHKYYVQKDGTIAQNTMVWVDKKGYFAGSNGAIVVGPYKYKNQNFLANANGVRISRCDLHVVNGKTYYVGKLGHLAVSRTVKIKARNAEGKKVTRIYRASDTGAMKTGVYKWGKNYYYAAENGITKQTSGVITWKNEQYYVQKDSTIACGKFIDIKNKLYYANDNGTIAKKAFTYNGVKVTPDSKTGVIGKDVCRKFFGSDYPYEKYILIDINSQTLQLYNKGKVVFTSKVVTGDVKNGTQTPTGKFSIVKKAKNYVLRQSGTFVQYWMPLWKEHFGLHDASWRSSFGGTIYKKNGSHGCVNMPASKIKKLYNMVDEGTPVVIR